MNPSERRTYPPVWSQAGFWVWASSVAYAWLSTQHCKRELVVRNIETRIRQTQRVSAGKQRASLTLTLSLHFSCSVLHSTCLAGARYQITCYLRTTKWERGRVREGERERDKERERETDRDRLTSKIMAINHLLCTKSISTGLYFERAHFKLLRRSIMPHQIRTEERRKCSYSNNMKKKAASPCTSMYSRTNCVSE